MFERRKIQKILDQYPQLGEEAQSHALQQLASYGKICIPYVLEALQRKRVHVAEGKRIFIKIYAPELMEDFIRILGDPRPDIRGMLKEVILERAGQSAAAVLLDHFDHADFQVRRSVTDLLLSLANKTMVPKVSKFLRHGVKEVQKNAVELLGGIGGPEAARILTSLFDEADWTLRRKAVESICKAKEKESLPALSGLLEKEKDPTIIKCILDAFYAIGDSSICRCVLPLLRNDDLILRQKAVDVLGKTALAEHIPDLMVLMKDGNVNVRRSAVEVLNAIRDPNAGKILIGCIKDSDWWVREIATDALAEISGHNINRLIVNLLEDKDEYIRRSAVEYFNRVVYPPAYQPLLKLLQDKDWWVREKAMIALAKFQNAEIIPHILRLAKDKETQWIIPQVLGELKSPEAIPPLVALSKNGDGSLRASAIKALGNIDHPEALKHIKEAMDDPDPEVAQTAKEIVKEREQWVA